MSINIPKILPKEITDKYTIDQKSFLMDKIKNADLDLYDGKPKDEINVIVGDDKQPDTFLPQIKLQRWSNETNFSIRLKDTAVATESVSTLQNKIKYSKGNIDIEYYDSGEDEYKMVWWLKAKPATNKVEFTIQSKGLDFFYQPPLTQKEIDDGAVRPENVVGSYAVYHSTKGGLNDKNGKDYKTGKAFHIYRPHLFDSNGLEAWGNLHIENGIYSVEIPQDFLDKAVYPIKSNDTFGYTTLGGSTSAWGYAIYGMWQQMGASNGTGDSISFGCAGVNGQKFTQGLYDNHTSGSLLTGGDTTEVTGDTDTKKFYTANFTGSPSLTANTYYLICSDAESDSPLRSAAYDSTTNTYYYYSRTNYLDWPSSITFSTATNNNYSIYVTYTVGGAPSHSPSSSPSSSASSSPSSSVSSSPSSSISGSPSSSASSSPSSSVSSSPSPSVSGSPSSSLSSSPSSSISGSPSSSISGSLSSSASSSPSSSISGSSSSSISGSLSASISGSPSVSPSSSVSSSISSSPSSSVSSSPSTSISSSPSSSPSSSISSSPSSSISSSPSASPSGAFDNEPFIVDSETTAYCLDLNEWRLSTKRINTDTTISDKYKVYFVSGTTTITLPTAVGRSGRVFHIKNITSGVITIVTTGLETIDGETSQVLSEQYDNMMIISNNSNWLIL